MVLLLPAGPCENPSALLQNNSGVADVKEKNGIAKYFDAVFMTYTSF